MRRGNALRPTLRSSIFSLRFGGAHPTHPGSVAGAYRTHSLAIQGHRIGLQELFGGLLRSCD